MSVLDAAIMVGIESTYGTPTTLVRAFEGKADAMEREHSRIESAGFRGGNHTLRSDRTVTVNMGATGAIELDLLNKGMGMLLGGTLGTKASPVQQESTTAYSQVFETDADAPADSFTIQILRPTMETGSQPFTYHGCKITGWDIKQSTDGLLTMTFDFDAEDSDTVTTAGTPSYPADSVPFDWTNCTITLDPDGTPETLDVMDLSFTADLGLKTDRRYLRGSELKKEPVRSALPNYAGELMIDFSDTNRYDEWVNQTTVDIEIVWTAGNIEGAYDHEFRMRMPACHWTNANPKVSLAETPVQALPFNVMHNGTDAAITMTYQSTDITA